MQVMLRENVENLGRLGDIVQVSDGYARNYLLPRKLVVVADQKNKSQMEHHKRILEKKRQAFKLEAEELAKKLSEFSCNIMRKVDGGDKLYGSVTTGDIAGALNKAGFQVDKKSIQLDVPIKSLGVHAVKIRLESDITAQMKVWVVKEE